MRRIFFNAVGNPKGQPRVRATKRGSHVGVYDPGTANQWKSIIKNAAKAQMDGVPFSGPTRVSWTAFFQRPKSHFKANGKLKPEAPEWHTTKPDRDNLDKAILDALVDCGVLEDDKQVCCGQLAKRYAPIGEQAGISVDVVCIQ